MRADAREPLRAKLSGEKESGEEAPLDFMLATMPRALALVLQRGPRCRPPGRRGKMEVAIIRSSPGISIGLTVFS